MSYGTLVINEGALVLPIVDIKLSDGKIVFTARSPRGDYEPGEVRDIRVHGEDGSHIASVPLGGRGKWAQVRDGHITISAPMIVVESGPTPGSDAGVWQRQPMPSELA